MSHNTLIHRLVRPGVRALSRTGVLPNHLTTLRLVTGVLGAIGFAQGGVLWPNIGAGFQLISLLLDRADGELARQTRTMSRGGHRYDLICDCIATVAGFLGMGWGVRSVFGPISILLGVAAGASVAIVFWLINVVKLTSLASAGAQDRVLADPDDAMLMSPLLVWLGLMPWAVAIAAVATPVVALVLGILSLLKVQDRESRRC